MSNVGSCPTFWQTLHLLSSGWICFGWSFWQPYVQPGVDGAWDVMEQKSGFLSNMRWAHSWGKDVIKNSRRVQVMEKRWWKKHLKWLIPESCGFTLNCSCKNLRTRMFVLSFIKLICWYKSRAGATWTSWPQFSFRMIITKFSSMGI